MVELRQREDRRLEILLLKNIEPGFAQDVEAVGRRGAGRDYRGDRKRGVKSMDDQDRFEQPFPLDEHDEGHEQE